MPKYANYSKGFIYKIVCNDITIQNTYGGSSTDFTKRKSCHKSACNNENDKSHNTYVYQFMRENGGWENFTMLKICEYPCQNKFELELEERRFMELLKSDLNKQKPGRTPKEYRDEDDHKEKMKKYQDVYQENNKEKIKQYQKDNKEEIKEYREKYCQDNKDKIKKYYEDNKEKYYERSRVYGKVYHEDNKEKIHEQKNAIDFCPTCGCNYTHSNKSQHIKTKKHINTIQPI